MDHTPRPVVRNPRASGTLIAVATASLLIAVAGCKSAPPTDAALTQAVQARLAADSVIASEPIQPSVQAGVVTLEGTVSSAAARSLAANDVAQVAGVNTVVNNLGVQTPLTLSARHSAKLRKDAAAPPKLGILPPPSQQSAAVMSPAPIERPTPVLTPPTLPAAAFKAVTLPSDTVLPIRITQTLDSATTRQGDTFTGVVDSDIILDGVTALPQGTPVSGRVAVVQEAAHFKGNSLLTIALTRIDGKAYDLPISTDAYSKAGQGRGKNSGEKVGGGAAVGAILGGILGGGKGAAIGAAAGGGAGAGVQAVTKGQQVQIPAESLVRFRLTNSVVVRAATGAGSAPGSSNPDLQHRDVH
jgi:hypothetical protein